MKRVSDKIPKGYIRLDDLHRKWMKNPAYRKAYEDSELEWQIINLLVKARIEQKLTQKQLAKRLGVSQPAISKLERGNFNPSVRVLRKIAKGLDAKLTITIS